MIKIWMLKIIQMNFLLFDWSYWDLMIREKSGDLISQTMGIAGRQELLGYMLLPSFLLFFVGLFSIAYSQKNLLIVLMGIEVMLLGVSLSLEIFSLFLIDPRGHILVLLIMTVAAAEIVIALAICVALYRIQGSVNLNTINKLRG